MIKEIIDNLKIGAINLISKEPLKWVWSLFWLHSLSHTVKCVNVNVIH